MELTLSMFLIVCPLAFLAGVVDAIGGGGGLISIPAYMLAGLPANVAVYTNKLSASFGLVTSTIRYCKNKFIDYQLAVIGIITAAIGAFIGAKFALIVDETIFKILLLILLPLTAIYVLLKKDLEPKTVPAISRKKQYVIVSVVTMLVGIYGGFYGPGSGTFLILAYSGFAKMKLLQSEGNAKIIDATIGLCSLAVFLYNDAVIIPLGLTAALFSTIGSYIGTGLAIKNGNKIIRIVILSVIALLFIKIIIDAGFKFLDLL